MGCNVPTNLHSLRKLEKYCTENLHEWWSVSTPFTKVCHLQKKQLALYLAFLDVAKAYDSVDKETLWKIFCAMAVLLKKLCVIKLLYETPDIKSN